MDKVLVASALADDATCEPACYAALMRGYHGTYRRLKRFHAPRGDHPSQVGVWFTAARDIAEKFARQASARWVDADCRVLTVEVRLESPKSYSTYAEYLADWRRYGSAAKLRRALQRDGHDGVVVRSSTTDFPTRRVDFAVFDPAAIQIEASRTCGVQPK